MEINPSEVTKILKEQINKFGDKAEVSGWTGSSVGMVLQEFMVLITYKQVKWSNFQTDQKV